MTVRFYSSLDTGAPSLSGTRLIDRMRAILMACLVTGYGEKTAAGWTVGHDHADGFSLNNGEGIINLVHFNNDAYLAYIMESITSGTTALASGINRRSSTWYDGASSAERQVLYVTGRATNAHWYVVADDKSCIVLLGGSTTTAEAVAGNGVSHIFGRYLNAAGLGGFCSLGGAESQYSATGTLIGFGGTLLRHPFTGVVDQGAAPRCACLAAQYQTAVRVSRSVLQPSRLTPVRAGLMAYGAGLSATTSAASAVFCGQLRGVVSDPVLSGALASQVLPLLGSSNTWQARVTPISLANGTQWLPLFAAANDYGFFVSLDPADWE